MQIFKDASVSQFWIMLVFCTIVYVMIRRAKAGMKVPPIRKINGLEAIDEAIGRATEMGRPVHATPGLGDISSSETFAFWGILGHVAKLCAKYDTRLIQTNRDEYIYAINEEIIKQAYLEAGRPDAFNPDDVRYISGWQFAYATAVLGIFQREKVAANIMIGYFYAESLIFAEGGYQAGAIQIAGTTSTFQLPFFIAACDYVLIGEEIYAASAYISKDPVLVGSVIGQDWGKIAVFAFIIVGTILANVQAQGNWLKDILSK
ncbi:MAG: DUF6754 domain-containing protein [Bacillota bacterium]|jgi:hypothetical protein